MILAKKLPRIYEQFYSCSSTFIIEDFHRIKNKETFFFQTPGKKAGIALRGKKYWGLNIYVQRARYGLNCF